ncbi:MAG: SemiSWEET transporter [Agriterribacter sp.]
MEINPIFIGTAAGIFTAVSMIPQLVKIIREKKAEQVSVPMIIILLVGISLWIWYGAVRNDLPILLTNGFSFLVNVTLVYFSLKFKKAY